MIVVRQIRNKTCDKAIEYKEWIDKLCQKNETCTNYYSSHKYCNDIKANLILKQDGVCAYTEIELDDPSQFSDNDWTNGKYTGVAQFEGTLDHFDSSLKDKGRESWLWENFFFVHPRINTQKNDAIVYGFLKPDEEDYSPEKYLDYDIDLHVYTVNNNITEVDMIKQVKYMIDNCLLLNFGFIERRRRKYLNRIFANYYAGIEKLEEIPAVDQFFTAFEYMKKKLDVSNKVNS
jgi:ribulose bisphosphate carboxylase small subunit